MSGSHEQPRVAPRRVDTGPLASPQRARIAGPAWGIAAFVFVAAGQAQEPRRGETQAVQITDVGGFVEFLARHRDQDQESKVGAGAFDYTETIFEENLQLEVEGYGYHPNLVEFSLAGLFGLLQQDYREDLSGRERTFSEDGDLLGFDLSAHFLKKKPYPGTIFAHRQRNVEPRLFQSSLQVTTTDLGLVWQYVSEKTPTSFQFNHTDVELDPLDPREETGRQRSTLARFETAYNFSEHNAVSFLYSRQSVEERPFELDFDSDELTLSHRLDFGGPRRHRLDSELNYFDQRGTFDIERVRWREILRLEHSDRLRSWYQFELFDRKQGSLAGVQPIEERSYTVSATLEHELYDSLVSQFSVFAQRQDFRPDLTIKQVGALANLDYRKTNPWGVLLASYQARIEREDRTGGDQAVEVIDQRATFNDPEPVILTNENVDTGSIFITAEDRTTIYHVGRDYLVFVRGNFVEIERVPSGRIQDGAIVLIDYVFTLFGNFTFDTLGQTFRIRQNFDFGLSPYYHLRWQDQTISPRRTGRIEPEDITANIVGAEYRWGRARLQAEYEDHDSNLTPFTAVRLNGEYTHRFKFGATGSIKARWSDISFTAPVSRDTTFFTVEGRYRHPLTDHLTFEGVVLYRTEDDSLSGDQDGVDVDLSLEWFIRQTEVRITYEFGRFDDDFAENEHSTLFVQVKRRF